MPAVGLRLRSAATSLRCGEFASTISALCGEAVASGAPHFWLDCDAPEVANDPIDARVSEVASLLGREIAAARAREQSALHVSVAPAGNSSQILRNYPASYVTNRVESVLRASKLEVLGNLFLTAEVSTIGTPQWSELAGALGDLVRGGKVLGWGVIPVFSDEDDNVVPATVAPLATAFSLFKQAGRALWSGEHQREIFLLEPLSLGLLTGSIGAASLFHRFDPRAERWSSSDLQKAAVAVAKLGMFCKRFSPAAQSCADAKQVCEKILHLRSPEQASKDGSAEPVVGTVLELALRYALSQPVTAVLVGAKSREQWRDMFSFAHTALDAGTLFRLTD